MANLKSISPFFIVRDLHGSVAFYTEKLGFETRFTGPENDPYFAIVGRDQVSIMLKEIEPGTEAMPNQTRHQWARWDGYVSAADPETLFEEYKAAGVNFIQPLSVNSDNLLGFEIEDADGYVLFFGKPNQ
jgi:catechol 2,3-dioxygenase-like lactoylglutathione lyase family enzyme